MASKYLYTDKTFFSINKVSTTPYFLPTDSFCDSTDLGVIWDHLGPLRIISDHIKLFGTTRDHLRPLCTIWDYLGPLGTH